jgi:hypothetical protein
MSTILLAQCPVCGNSAEGRITITANCSAKIYQGSFDYFDSFVIGASDTQCDACLHRAPFSEFASGVKPLSSTELEELVTFLGKIAEQHRHLNGERMAKRCIGQLRYLARPSTPATAGDDQ